MSNRDIADSLRFLRRRFSNEEVSIPELAFEFERLTYGLLGIDSTTEHRLVDLVNDIEIIRFTRLVESQTSDILKVLESAQELFDQNSRA